MRVGAGVCPDCLGDVLRLPALDGIETLDTGEFPVTSVPDGDRFLALPHRVPTQPDGTDPHPPTCLRRHRCPGPTERGRRAGVERVRLLSRSDFTALHRFSTQVELYRAQALGRLRRHPGQRVYSPVAIPRGIAELGRLDPKHCVLCRCGLDADEAIEIGFNRRRTRPVAGLLPPAAPPRRTRTSIKRQSVGRCPRASPTTAS